MRSLFVAAFACAVAVAPSMADLGTAVSRRVTVFLAEASGPSVGGRDTALVADAESNGPTRFGRDGAQLAESSGPSVGGRDTALVADAESNGPTRFGRDGAQLA